MINTSNNFERLWDLLQADKIVLIKHHFRLSDMRVVEAFLPCDAHYLKGTTKDKFVKGCIEFENVFIDPESEDALKKKLNEAQENLTLIARLYEAEVKKKKEIQELFDKLNEKAAVLLKGYAT